MQPLSKADLIKYQPTKSMLFVEEDHLFVDPFGLKQNRTFEEIDRKGMKHLMLSNENFDVQKFLVSYQNDISWDQLKVIKNVKFLFFLFFLRLLYS